MATVVPTDGVVWLSRGLNPRQRARREAVLLSPRTRSTASTAVQVPNPNRACPSMCSRRVERELELWRADVVSSPRGRRRHVAAYTVVCTSILYSALRSAVDRFTAPFIGSQRLSTAPFRSFTDLWRRAAARAVNYLRDGPYGAAAAPPVGHARAHGPSGRRPRPTASGARPPGPATRAFISLYICCVYLGMRWRDRKIYQVHRFPAP